MDLPGRQTIRGNLENPVAVDLARQLIPRAVTVPQGHFRLAPCQRNAYTADESTRLLSTGGHAHLHGLPCHMRLGLCSKDARMASTNGTARQGDDFAARLAMVRDQLERRDITDARVVDAMREVPRHLFVPPAWRHEAYSDKPLPIGEGQTISQPYMVAIMLQQLALQDNDRVLEVGTGSGYQTAVLSRLAGQVYSLEYFPELAAHARALLQRLGYPNVQVLVADGGLGLPEFAPYAGIIVAAAAPQPPVPLLAQLAEGGRLVVPVGSTSRQELLLITKQAGAYHEQRSVHCRFVPLLGQEGWHDA